MRAFVLMISDISTCSTTTTGCWPMVRKPPISWLRWPRNTVYASEKYMNLSADSKPTAISLQWNEIAPEWNKHMCTIPLPAINDTP